MSVDDRLRRLEDVEAIRRLMLDYRRCLDAKDIRGYAELFAAEGEFVAGDMRATGPQEIFELVDGMRGTLLTDRGGDHHPRALVLGLGRIGVWSRALRYNPDRVAAQAAVAELEALGYGAVWL